MPFSPSSLFFPSVSANRILPKHENYLCDDCGLVFLASQPAPDLLRSYYEDIYRKSDYSIRFQDKTLDLPIQFPESAQSFLRFKNFAACLESVAPNRQDVLPRPEDTIIDLGGYQGMFLYAAKQAFGSEGIVVDMNRDGIEFAKRALGFGMSELKASPLDYSPQMRARFVTMIHSFEHMERPLDTLVHIRNNILDSRGFLYIEVPNLHASPLSDPTHLFSFSLDSLSYALEKSGYEILRISTTGNEHAPLTISSDELVICCLATPTQPSNGLASEDCPPPARGSDTRSAVLRNYRRLSRRGIARQARKALMEAAKLAYYLLSYILLERLPGNVHRTVGIIKKYTRIRLH